MSDTVLHDVTRADLAALVRVSLALAESPDAERVMQVAVEGAVEVLGLETGAIFESVDNRNPYPP